MGFGILFVENKKERGLLRSDREVFSKNEEIINEYESFVCDSAKAYLRENLAIAGRLRANPAHRQPAQP